MAKRPPSRSKSEEDEIGTAEVAGPGVETSDAVVGDAAEVEKVAPVAMEEPARSEPGPEALGLGEAWIDKGQESDVDVSGVVATEESTVVADTSDTPAGSPQPPSAKSDRSAEKGGGGFLGTALGGVVAAAAGYALATFVPFPGIGISDGPPTATQAEVQALAERIALLETAPERSAEIADRVAALESRPVPESRPEPDLAPLTDSLTALESRVAAIETRAPSQLGEAPSTELTALVESLRAEVAEMQAIGEDANAEIEALAAQTEARLAEAEAQAAALRAEAEQTARRAVNAAALGRVQAALESGVPFAGALADIPDVEIPAALSGFAETGVPSRAALQDAFPPAARAALEASLRANMGEGWSDRVTSFLQATTGARSLVPREGSDPDAVLSRAEAAVRSGDLAQALVELENLPAEGQAEMADWIVMAQQRLDAIAAASTLSAAVEG